MITAVVVGGVAIFGGSGSVVGAALGALLLTTISSALYVLGISPSGTRRSWVSCSSLAISVDRSSSRLAAKGPWHLRRLRGAAAARE